MNSKSYLFLKFFFKKDLFAAIFNKSNFWSLLVLEILLFSFLIVRKTVKKLKTKLLFNALIRKLCLIALFTKNFPQNSYFLIL